MTSHFYSNFMSQSFAHQLPIFERIYPISVEAYHLLFEKGFISEKTELLEGVVIEKMPKDPIHANLVTQLVFYLYEKLKNRYTVRQENPISAQFSEPEPDIAVVPFADYSASHPKEAHLIIEVANSTLALDRSKASIYAACSVPEYIIMNLQNTIMEIYSAPSEGKYTVTKMLRKNEVFQSEVLPEISFSMNDFF